MTPSVDTAKDLLQLAGGPSILGVGALLTYATSVLNDNRRDSSKGWLAVGAGALLLAWLALFLALSATTVWASLTATGPIEPVLVLLAAAWIVCAGLWVVVARKAPVAMRYLIESYRPDETPWALRWIRGRLE